MFCSNCGKNIGEQPTCPFCGQDMSDELTPQEESVFTPPTPEPDPTPANPVRYTPPVAPPHVPADTKPPKKFKPPKAKKKKSGLIIGISVGAAVLLVGAAVLVFFLTADSRNYNKAKSCMENGQYQEAIDLFSGLGDYEDSSSLINECRYLNSKQLIADGSYDEAIDALTELGDYRDCKELITEARYGKAKKLCADGKYDEAIGILTVLGNYQDSTDLLDQCNYGKATNLMNVGNYQEAKAIFEQLGDYSDSKEKIKACDYAVAKDLMDSKPKEAVALLEGIGDYEDSKELLNKAKMHYCELNKNNDDTTTYQYLKDLKKEYYPGASALYDELYTYRVIDVFWNTSKDEKKPSSGVTKISKNKNQVLHFTLEGGTPDDTKMQINYTVTWPDGSKSNDKFNSRGVNYTITLENNLAGTVKVDIYTQDKKLLYTASVTVTN